MCLFFIQIESTCVFRTSLFIAVADLGPAAFNFSNFYPYLLWMILLLCLRMLGVLLVRCSRRWLLLLGCLLLLHRIHVAVVACLLLLLTSASLTSSSRGRRISRLLAKVTKVPKTCEERQFKDQDTIRIVRRNIIGYVFVDFSQIHLNFFSPYLQVQLGHLQTDL